MLIRPEAIGVGQQIAGASAVIVGLDQRGRPGDNRTALVIKQAQVVLLATGATEDQRVEQLIRCVRRIVLAFKGQRTRGGRCDGCVDRAALREELVQLEREAGRMFRAAQLAAAQKQLCQPVGTGREGQPRQSGKLCGTGEQGHRIASAQTPVLVLAQPKAILNPGGQRIVHEMQPVLRQRTRERCAQLGGAWRRGADEAPAERLVDHLLGRERCAKQRAGNGRHRGVPLAPSSAGGHGGAGADRLELRIAGSLTEAAHEERNIGALSPAIGMQLVEHEELKLPGLREKRPLLRPGQHELQHHIVRQQDVGRMLADSTLLCLALLAGVAGEAHRAGIAAAEVLGETREGLLLRVDQRVHRVDDDRAHAASFGRVAQDVINDGDKVGQAFARAGPGSHHVVQALGREVDRGALMLVEPKGAAVDLKKLPANLMEQILRDQLCNRFSGLVGRAKLEQRVGPEHPVRQLLVDKAADAGVEDSEEALDVLCVVGDDGFAKAECVHKESGAGIEAVPAPSIAA